MEGTKIKILLDGRVEEVNEFKYLGNQSGNL